MSSMDWRLYGKWTWTSTRGQIACLGKNLSLISDFIIWHSIIAFSDTALKYRQILYVLRKSEWLTLKSHEVRRRSLTLYCNAFVRRLAHTIRLNTVIIVLLNEGTFAANLGEYIALLLDWTTDWSIGPDLSIFHLKSLTIPSRKFGKTTWQVIRLHNIFLMYQRLPHVYTPLCARLFVTDHYSKFNARSLTYDRNASQSQKGYSRHRLVG